jgi:hypothetical protein
MGLIDIGIAVDRLGAVVDLAIEIAEALLELLQFAGEILDRRVT